MRMETKTESLQLWRVFGNLVFTVFTPHEAAHYPLSQSDLSCMLDDFGFRSHSHRNDVISIIMIKEHQILTKDR